MHFLMISAFGNMCAYTEQLLGLNVIFGILQQAFGLNGHFLLILLFFGFLQQAFGLNIHILRFLDSCSKLLDSMYISC